MTAPKKYDLKKVIEHELQKTKPLVITFGDDSVSVPPAILWPDDVFTSSDADGARLILGDKYVAFTAAGGTALLLFELVKQHTGASLPE